MTCKAKPRIAALVLAAGRSTRMGMVNKLLIELDGQAMIARVAAAVQASRADPVIVVTGYQQEAIEAALAGRGLLFAQNPRFESGLSSSLRHGMAALPNQADGVVICLGDMPRVTADVIDRLIAAFNPPDGHAICLPTWHGKRGNPVIFARRFFAKMQVISGDVGARSLIEDYAEMVCEVPMNDDAVLIDVDTPRGLKRQIRL